MAEIKAGDQIEAGWWPASVENDDGTAISNISDTSYVPGSPEVGVSFTSPLSGRVGVCVAAGMREDSATNRLFVTYELYEGTSASGSLIRSRRAQFGVSTSGDSTASGEMVYGNMSMVDGLTPGVDHYARIMYVVEGGATNDITRRRLIVIPLP